MRQVGRAQLLDQPIGSQRQRLGDCQTELPSRFHVDDEFEFRRLFDRKFGGLSTGEDPLYEARHRSAVGCIARTVRHKAAVFDELSAGVNGWQSVLGCKAGDAH